MKILGDGRSSCIRRNDRYTNIGHTIKIERRSVEHDGRAYDGFDGDLEGKVRQLELENDILRGVVDVLKGASLGSLTNREKTLLIDHLRRETGRRLNELTTFLRISKSSYEYQRSAIAKGDKYASIRPLVVDAFEASNKTRGYRYVTHELRTLDEPVVVSEKVVRRIMTEEGCRVIYLKKAKHYSSYKGEITEAPENLVGRNFHADAPNELWLSDITVDWQPFSGHFFQRLRPAFLNSTGLM